MRSKIETMRTLFTGALLGLLLASPAGAEIHWGDWQITCTGYGTAKYAARLWDIPPFVSWEQSCADMTTRINGVTYAEPSACVNVGGVEMWGEFHDVPDSSCVPHWGDFRDDGCVPGEGFSGLRQHSAILWDIPWGVSWEDACSITGATLDGVWHDRPAVCLQSDFSWLGSIVSIVAGAAVGVVTVNPAAGVAAGVATSTAILGADEASGGFGAMNEWGVFYAVDATCGELAGSGGGGGGGGEGGGGGGGGQTPMELTREAASCQRAIGLATGKLTTTSHKLDTRCRARTSRGRTCDSAGVDAKLERASARAERRLAKRCSADELVELGFTGSADSVRATLLADARGVAGELAGDTHLVTGALPGDLARCQRAIGRATGKVLKKTHGAHARCLAEEARGRGCDATERDEDLERARERGVVQIGSTCSAEDLDGLALSSPASLVEMGSAGAEVLIQETHPRSFSAKP